MSRIASSTAARRPSHGSSRASKHASYLRRSHRTIQVDGACQPVGCTSRVVSAARCWLPPLREGNVRNRTEVQKQRKQLYLSTDARSINCVPPLVNIQPAQVVNIQPAPTHSLQADRSNAEQWRRLQRRVQNGDGDAK